MFLDGYFQPLNWCEDVSTCSLGSASSQTILSYSDASFCFGGNGSRVSLGFRGKPWRTDMVVRLSWHRDVKRCQGEPATQPSAWNGATLSDGRSWSLSLRNAGKEQSRFSFWQNHSDKISGWISLNPESDEDYRPGLNFDINSIKHWIGQLTT